MLVKAIYCERMKCKGTLIWPAFLIIPGDAVLRHLFLSAPDWNLLCLFVAV